MRLVVSSAFEAELNSAIEWYLARSEVAAGRLLDCVDATVARIRDRPHSFAVVRDTLRRAVVHGFPYVVYFEVRTDRLNILGLVHQRRHPGRWPEQE